MYTASYSLSSPELAYSFKATPAIFMLVGWFFCSLTSLFLEICSTLTCYKCSASTRNSSCFLEPARQQTVRCNSSFCQVWKLHSDVNGQVYMFERDCSSTCAPGCITLSDTENRFISCSSCCQMNGCNTDNHGTTMPAQPSFFYVLLVFHIIFISNM